MMTVQVLRPTAEFQDLRIEILYSEAAGEQLHPAANSNYLKKAINPH